MDRRASVHGTSGAVSRRMNQTLTAIALVDLSAVTGGKHKHHKHSKHKGHAASQSPRRAPGELAGGIAGQAGTDAG